MRGRYRPEERWKATRWPTEEDFGSEDTERRRASLLPRADEIRDIGSWGRCQVGTKPRGGSIGQRRQVMGQSHGADSGGACRSGSWTRWASPATERATASLPISSYLQMATSTRTDRAPLVSEQERLRSAANGTEERHAQPGRISTRAASLPGSYRRQRHRARARAYRAGDWPG